MSEATLDPWWRALRSAALVGTSRRTTVTPADLPASLGRVVPREDDRPEQRALDAAALGGAVRRAGRRSVAAGAPPPAPVERLAEAPARAQELLELLLTQSPADPAGTLSLLAHWCTCCRTSGARVPHRLLPALLRRATDAPPLRPAVVPVLGERGAWLARQHPDWHVVVGDAPATADMTVAPTEAEWALLPTERRAAHVAALRADDPAAGLALVAGAWASESAKDRRTLLDALRVGLGPDDEAFLEAALDDRAASVRDLAARLLDGLPDSARAARMAERLRPLVSESGLLRRRIEVTLPDDPDASGRRDGLGKAPAGRSARGWWLERIVAGAPFSVWDGTAEHVVSRLSHDDALAGLRTAAVQRRDPEWARALLDHGGPLSLLPVLPSAERHERAVVLLGRAGVGEVAALLAQVDAPWSEPFSSAVVARLGRTTPEQLPFLLEAVLPHLSRGLHPDAVPLLLRWRAKADLPRGTDHRLGAVAQARTLIPTISEAFPT